VVKERVELYIHYPSWPSCTVLSWTLPEGLRNWNSWYCHGRHTIVVSVVYPHLSTLLCPGPR